MTARRRRRLRVVGVLAAIAGALALVAVLFQFGPPWSGGPGDELHVHSSEHGQQVYSVHVPPQHREGGERLPVMMALHGCGMTGFGLNSMRDTTQFDALADEEGFIVVYPTQRVFSDRLNCWRSADPRHQRRGAGEPALLAGVAAEVVDRYGADPDRVHVAGASSGAGTAVILAATYPDVFATSTSVAGGEYALDMVDADDPGATPPSYTAGLAAAQMGERARQVPMLVVQGTDDEVVTPIVGERLVEHRLSLADLVDDGAANGTVDAEPDDRVEERPDGGHPYSVESYTASGARSILDVVLVEGMGHSWSGPRAAGLFSDQRGPDLARMAWDFASARPMSGAR